LEVHLSWRGKDTGFKGARFSSWWHLPWPDELGQAENLSDVWVLLVPNGILAELGVNLG
jgi:hypothetical protein